MPLGRASGGKEQAEKAYAEALGACFDLQVEVHQHVQPYTSSKDGSLKWALLEMWPLLVSTHGCPVLCGACAYTTSGCLTLLPMAPVLNTNTPSDSAGLFVAASVLYASG